MAINFLALPALQSPGGYNFEPLGKGFDAIREGKKDNRLLDIKQQAQDLDRSRFGLEEQKWGTQKKGMELEQEAAFAKRFGGVAQMWMSESDPARQAQMFQRFTATDPRIGAAIGRTLPKELHNDPISVGRYFTALAAGYQDPLDREAKRVNIDQDRQAIASAAGASRRADELHPEQLKQLQQKPQGQVKEVNGKLVYVAPGGMANQIYDSGPNFDKLPEYSAKSAGFTTRMVDAEDNVRRITADPKTFNPTGAQVAITNALPEGVANYTARTKEHQQYAQAAEQWIRAFLRKESGAAIGRDEFIRDFKVYFPQPGDDPKVIAQKQSARLSAMKAFSGETRGFFDHNSPGEAAKLKGWNEPAAPSTEVSQPMPRISSDAEFDALPSKTRFVDPNGRIRTKP